MQELYRVEAFPMAYLIDREGRILKKQRRARARFDALMALTKQ